MNQKWALAGTAARNSSAAPEPLRSCVRGEPFPSLSLVCRRSRACEHAAAAAGRGCHLWQCCPPDCHLIRPPAERVRGQLHARAAEHRRLYPHNGDMPQALARCWCRVDRRRESSLRPAPLARADSELQRRSRRRYLAAGPAGSLCFDPSLARCSLTCASS